MADSEQTRLVLDIVSSLLGLLAGLLLLLSGTVGLPNFGGVAFPVVVMGLLGAAFSLVGVGHIYVDANVRGAGEFAAGVGVMLIGLSFGVQPQFPPFAIGLLVLVAGMLVLLADSFEIDLPERFR